jgi:hypothetical protein
MGTKLAAILSAPEFAEAELAAMRLDGEVFRVDQCASPIDEVSSPSLRAAALALELPPRLIVEQRSAAWLWGALATPPVRHEVCADIGARTRPPDWRRLAIREVVIGSDDVIELDGLKVTTPVRTATDIVRFSPDFGPEDADIVTSLMNDWGFGVGDCEASMSARKNLPNRHIALTRLGQLFETTSHYVKLAGADAVDVVDGVDPSHRIQHSVKVRRVAHFEDEPAEGETVARRRNRRGQDVHVVLAEHAGHI